MEELQSALRSILSDPEQMARVAALAESLGLKQGPSEETPPDQPRPAPDSGQSERSEEAAPAGSPPLGVNASDLAGLMSGLSSLNGSEDRLLNALRPGLSAEGQSRIDRALRAAKLSRLAGRLLAGRGERRV